MQKNILRFLCNCDASVEQIRISSAEVKFRILHRIDARGEMVKIFRIYSFHRFYGRIRKALSSRAKALETRQLCQMSFSVPANLIDCFVPLLCNISQSFSRLSPAFHRPSKRHTFDLIWFTEIFQIIHHPNEFKYVYWHIVCYNFNRFLN